MRVSHAGVGVGGGMLLGISTGDGDAAVLGEGNIEAIVVPAAAEDDKGVAESGDEEDVENAKEDHALGDTNDIAAVRDTPGNGIEEPQEVGPAREHRVIAVDTNTVSRAAGAEQGLKSEEDVGKSGKGKETPLVVGRNIGGDEVTDDPDPREEDVENDGSPRDAGEDAHGEDSRGERDDP